MPKSKGKAKVRAKKEQVVTLGGVGTNSKPQDPMSSIFTGYAANQIAGMGATKGLTAFKNSAAFGILGAPESTFPSGSMFAASPSTGGDTKIAANKRGNPRNPTKIEAGLDIEADMSIEAAGVELISPLFHSPGNSQNAYDLPKSYVEQIRWTRLMYNLNAYISAITDLKAYYPFSKFDIMTPEPFVTEFYTKVAFNNKFNLYRFALRQSLMKEKFGEYCSWGSRSQDGIWAKTGKPKWIFDNFILLEPELMEVKKPLVGNGQPQVFLRPSRDLAELAEKLKAGDPEYESYKGKISDKVLQQIEKKKRIELDPSTVSLVQTLTDASALRGTPPYQRLYVTFVLEDFIRLSQMAQAQRFHFPVELWTLGNLEHKILPNPADLQNLQQLVNQAIQSPPFSIFFPPILNYEAVGANQKLLPVKADYEYIFNQYMVGMGVSEEMILGSSGIFSSTETSSNQAFIRGRIAARDEWEEWAKYNFFEPLARWNNLKTKKGDELVPIVPDLIFSKTLDYSSEERDTKNSLDLWQKGLYPSKRLLTKFRENPDEIKAELEQEIGTVFDDGSRIKAPSFRKNPTQSTDGVGTRGPESPVGKEGSTEGGGGGEGGPTGGGGEEAPEETAEETPTEGPSIGNEAAPGGGEEAPIGNPEEIL